MPDFNESASRLDKARQAHAEAQLRQRDARQAVRDAIRRARDAQRSGRSGTPSEAAAAPDLKRREEEALRAAARAAMALRRAEEGFTRWSDPRKAVEQLPDSDPLLLFPLRLETRFKTVRTAGRDQPQLWVRVYPDSCLVDSFDERLSESELANAKTYWAERWCAAGYEEKHRAAWRQLTASHGAGRARHIVRSYMPLNAAEEPKAAEDEVFLVIPTQTPLPNAEAALLVAYWTAIWNAGGSPDGQQSAFDDLAAQIGSPEAQAAIGSYVPVRFAEISALRNKRRLAAVVLLILPSDPPTSGTSWSVAPIADPMPDRFVLILSRGRQRREVLGDAVRFPLHVGFDPTGLSSGLPVADGASLGFQPETLWLADFDEAVKAGMGFRVDLTDDEAQHGFDRLYVVGVSASSSQERGKERLETFVAHRLHSNADFVIVPQGTPTNNTEEADSGFARRSDPDQVFDAIMGEGLFVDEPSDRDKSDGQWLAEALGLDTAPVKRILFSDGQDQKVAQAMRTALWPGTIGYFLNTLLSPVLGHAGIAQARCHFIRHIVGAGRVPAIRIGQQPYGILPVTAFDRIAWLDGRVDHPRRDHFLVQLLPLLRDMAERWAGFASAVRQVGNAGDEGQALLDVLGLHPASAEFHFRFAQDNEQLANLLRLVSVNWADLREPEEVKRAVMDFLAGHGYPGAETPQIATLILQQAQGILDGGVVGSEPLQPGFETEHQAYIAWLAKTAEKSLATLRSQQGLPGGKVPHALLYILLRHALLLAYSDAAVRVRMRSPDFTEAHAAAEQREKTLPHILAEPAKASAVESKWENLLRVTPEVTGGERVPIADYLTANLGKIPETVELAAHIEALRTLARSTRAEADRALRHHLDTCSHRLDTWLLGISNAQLGRMERMGIYLGAYGWLEQLRPKTRSLMTAELSQADRDLLDPDGRLPTLMSDPDNGGLIHAPSLDQVVAGAMLRSAYMTMNSDEERRAVGVNLSSERVRAALSLMDGMRTGQSVNALLGYRFERGLHERYAEAETDEFLLELRQEFPLVANSLRDTKVLAAEKGKVVARNVVDGLKLVEHMRKTGQRTYPFGLALPPASAAAVAVISSEAWKLEDLRDALGDLALAESVYQSVQGNFDRAAAALDAFSKGEVAPVPDVVHTPSSGISLTHRVAVHLKPVVPPAPGATPRAAAEPELDAWLATILPSLSRIGCRVTWDDPVNGSREQAFVTLDALGLAPIDLVHLWQGAESDGAFAALGSLAAEHVIVAHAARFRCDAALTVEYFAGPAAGFSLMEAGALMRPVAALVKSARPLRPADLLLEGEATLAAAQSLEGDPSALNTPLATLTALSAQVARLLVECDTVLAGSGATHDTAVASIDVLIAKVVQLFVAAGRFGVEHSRPDRFRDMQRRLFAAVMQTAGALLADWQARAARYDAALAGLAGAAAQDRDAILRKADLEMPARLPATGPDSAALEASVKARRAAFTGLMDALRAVTTTRSNAIAPALTGLQTVLSDAQFRTEHLSTAKQRAEIGAAVAEIQAAAKALGDVVSKRVRAADDRLGEAVAEMDMQRKADLVAAAAQALFGEGFLHLPRFTMVGARLSEFDNARSAAQSGETLGHLVQTAGIVLPVDEWLNGVARVREPIQNLEATMIYGEALSVPEIALNPLQFPYKAKDSWLGLEFPEDYDIDGHKLLYTAHFAAQPDGSGRFKGLVIDEWTEVVPGTRRTAETKPDDVHSQTTGVAFHFDRPNAEAPQSFLLVTPATWDGIWHWADIVGALDSTWELMRIRAVEPEHLTEPSLGHMLPATFMATASRDITISAALASNIGVARFIKVQP